MRSDWNGKEGRTFRAARQSKRGDRVEKDETTGVEYVDVTFPMLVYFF